jgi:hypothetical protein
MVCCDYARLNFSTPEDIQFYTPTTPFYLTGRDRHLVYGGNTTFERDPWYACTEQGGSGIVVSPVPEHPPPSTFRSVSDEHSNEI